MTCGQISVVIAAYNAASYIKQAVVSVLEQARPPRELIVIDDCSTDHTADIAESFSSKGVLVVRNRENKGPGVRRNQGVDVAGGEYIALLDADNFWEPNHLEVVAGLLDQHQDAALAFSRMNIVGDHSGIWPLSFPCSHGPAVVLPELLRNNFIELSSIVVRRDLYQQIGGFVSENKKYKGRWVLADDYYFTMRMAMKHKIVGSQEVTVNYRTYPEQSSYYKAAAIAQAMRFKIKILKKLSVSVGKKDLTETCRDRVLLYWEESLEKTKLNGDIAGLVLLCKFGMQNSGLRKATWPYCFSLLTWAKHRKSRIRS